MASKLNVYCVNWCPDCKKTFRYLDAQQIPYDYHNIEELPADEVQKVNDANDGKDWVTPTFEYDGNWLALSSVSDEELPRIMERIGVLK